MQQCAASNRQRCGLICGPDSQSKFSCFIRGLPAGLAEEAVISEPVSTRWFPVQRENTGKFADFGLEIAKAPRLSEENSIAYQQNSLVA
jgi:hypothetical protein